MKEQKLRSTESRRSERKSVSPQPQHGLPRIAKGSDGRAAKPKLPELSFADQRAARVEAAERSHREAEQARRLAERERRTAERLSQLRETERIVGQTRELKARERQLRQKLVELKTRRDSSPTPVQQSRAEFEAQLISESNELSSKLQEIHESEWHDEVEARIEAERELVEKQRAERKQRLAERRERIRVTDERRFAEAQGRERRREQAGKERDERMQRGHKTWSDESRSKREVYARAAVKVPPPPTACHLLQYLL